MAYNSVSVSTGGLADTSERQGHLTRIVDDGWTGQCRDHGLSKLHRRLLAQLWFWSRQCHARPGWCGQQVLGYPKRIMFHVQH